MGGSLEDRVALGSSSGVCRAIARMLAREGALTIYVDLHPEPFSGGFDADAGLATVKSDRGGRRGLLNPMSGTPAVAALLIRGAASPRHALSYLPGDSLGTFARRG